MEVPLFSNYEYTIVNSSYMDRAGDACLHNVNYFSRLQDNTKKIREFEVDPITGICREVTPKDEGGDCLILKICKVVFVCMTAFFTLLFGAILKTVALEDADVQTKHQCLIKSGILDPKVNITTVLTALWGPGQLTNKHSIKFFDSDNALMNDNLGNSSGALTDVFYSVFLPYAGIKDLFNLMKVSKALWFGLHSNLYKEKCHEYQQQLNGMKRIPDIKNFNQLACHSSNYYQRNFNSNKELLQIFGDIKDILHLPVYVGSLLVTDLEKYPNVCRVKEGGSEMTAIKISILVPREENKTGEDQAEHGVITFEPFIRKNPFTWSIFFTNGGTFHDTSFLNLDSAESVERFKKFLKGEQSLDYYKNSDSKPEYIFDKNKTTALEGQRLFKGIPIMLGHVELSAFQEILKSDYLIDNVTDGNDT